MQINSNGIDREATAEEIAEIELVRDTAVDPSKELAKREKAKKVIADKLGITLDELSTLLS